MPRRKPTRPKRAATAAAVLTLSALVLGSVLTAISSGDLQSQIAQGRSAADSLRSQIAADTAQIDSTANGLHAAEARLARVQADLVTRESNLRRAQTDLLAARTRLLELENRLQRAAQALSANLVAKYEGSTPDVVTAVLEARGFKDLLERVDFLSQIGRQDARILQNTRTVRAQVSRQATLLASLEQRDRLLTDAVLAQRNQVAALQGALLAKQIAQVSARSGTASELAALNGRLKSLEAKAAAQARAAIVGGIRIETGGMVQPPPGAPSAVAQVMAAGNAIATLPYVWGGGHGSFQANGYDCSGSVSYALAAAGLLSSPLDSTGFESWGQPGPGQWITVYANAGHAFMTVAGWRFDTVALSAGGTRWSQSMTDTSGFVARHPPGL
jgi:peptidoglycan hydrolase CwlO-like protein